MSPSLPYPAPVASSLPLGGIWAPQPPKSVERPTRAPLASVQPLDRVTEPAGGKAGLWQPLCLEVTFTIWT